jgi:hypothetical protein
MKGATDEHGFTRMKNSEFIALSGVCVSSVFVRDRRLVSL